LKKKIFIWIAPWLFITLYSCDKNKVYEEYIEVKNGIWENQQTAEFNFNIKDTSSAHNIYIDVRNKGNYPYSNLYLFVTIKGPDGSLQKDTFNCVLADKRGKWYGKSIGDLWDYKAPFIGDFKFAQLGNYNIALQQAMRTKDGLKGISDIGIRVEKQAK